MPEILSTEHLNVGRGHDISVISGDGKIWVALTASERGGVVRFWSTKAGSNAGAAPAEEVVGCIRDRVLGSQAERLGSDSALTFWPNGWDCWAGGVPAAIANYFRAHFRDDLEAYRQRLAGLGPPARATEAGSGPADGGET